MAMFREGIMARGYTHLPWVYKGQDYETTPRNYEGFVYMITDTVTGKKYIGKKSFWSTNRVDNGKGRLVTTRVESEWKKYYSSNPEISKLSQGGNGARFRREILHLCLTKGTGSYLEAREIFDRRALEQPDVYYNQYVELKLNAGHIKLEK